MFDILDDNEAEYLDSLKRKLSDIKKQNKHLIAFCQQAKKTISEQEKEINNLKNSSNNEKFSYDNVTEDDFDQLKYENGMLRQKITELEDMISLGKITTPGYLMDCLADDIIEKLAVIHRDITFYTLNDYDYEKFIKLTETMKSGIKSLENIFLGSSVFDGVCDDSEKK